MPLIIILGILAIYGVAGHINKSHPKKYTHNDMENMLVEMTGKSKRECHQILKRHGRK